MSEYNKCDDCKNILCRCKTCPAQIDCPDGWVCGITEILCRNVDECPMNNDEVNGKVK